MSDYLRYCGDDLPIFARLHCRESGDLFYLNPPSNSNHSYNVLLEVSVGRELDAQMVAVDDTQHWSPTGARALQELTDYPPAHAVEIVKAMTDVLGHNDSPPIWSLRPRVRLSCVEC